MGNKQQRSKDEMIEELENLRNEISEKEAEKEELQSEINKAVAMEEYEKAGQLAPKKKKLILEAKELQNRIEELEQDIAQCIEEEEKSDKNTENETNIDDIDHGNNGVVQN